MTKHTGKSISTSASATVIDCKTCGFAHVNPLPSMETLNEFYEKRFYQDVKKNYFSDFERDEQWWRLNYNWLIDDFDKLLKKKGDKKQTLLDIGSGPGLFLQVCNERGLDVTGIEPSKDAFQYSSKKYNTRIYNTTLEQLEEGLKYDIVHTSLVLEHILDPLAFMKKSRLMLNKGGLMCVIVPNDFNPIQNAVKQMGKPEWWVSPFEHLNYFNLKSLKGLFEKAKFEVVHQSVTFPIDLFLLMGKDYLGNGDIGKECHTMRKTFEFNIDKTGSVALKDGLYKAFSKMNIGRELVVIGRKK